MNYTTTLLVALLTVLSVGCVQFKVKADDVVEDTVDATKDLYSSVKRRRDGKEARTYNHRSPITVDQTDGEAAVACLDTLKTIIEGSVEVQYEVVAQKTAVVNEDTAERAIDCEMVAEMEVK